METITIYGPMCDEQKNDIKQILALADNLVECATHFAASGGNGYHTFIQAKNDFETTLRDITKNYRRVSTVD